MKLALSGHTVAKTRLFTLRLILHPITLATLMKHDSGAPGQMKHFDFSPSAVKISKRVWVK